MKYNYSATTNLHTKLLSCLAEESHHFVLFINWYGQIECTGDQNLASILTTHLIGIFNTKPTTMEKCGNSESDKFRH